MNTRSRGVGVVSVALAMTLAACGPSDEKGAGGATPSDGAPGDRTGGGASDDAPSGGAQEATPPTEGGARQVDRATAHEFPELSVDSTGGEHVVVMQGPDPGWSLKLDGTEAAGGVTTVFVTIHRPVPGVMHPQVITEMRLETGVASGEKVEVAARVEGMDGTVPDAYHPVAGEG